MKETKSACPICDAVGSSGPCKGHGGGAGGSSGDTEKSNEKNDTKELKVGGSVSKIMLSLVMQPSSPTASAEVAHISQFPSVLNIDMDADTQTLTFLRNTLSLDVFKLISEHLESSIKELKSVNPHLADELSDIRFIGNDNKIIIETPSMRVFIMLVEHLMHQNLLPGINIPKAVQESRLVNSTVKETNTDQGYIQAASTDEHLEQTSSTAPNPFSMQLTPSGFGD